MTYKKLLLMLLAVPFCGVVLAQTNDDEPGRGVARISLINGDVSVRRGDSGDWVAAAVNAPLVVPDSIHTGDGSRAEVQLDYANMIRLAANTEVRFSQLEQRRYQVQVARGTLTFSVIRDSDADVDLSTPNVSVRPSRKGSYRVSVRPDGTTEITVRSGEAEIFTPRGVENLRAAKSMVVRGTASDPEFQILAAADRDDWDRWNEARDKELKRSRSYEYVSRDIYGADDLEGHGSWIHVPPYGWVWSPRVAAGWAPYRYGRWCWVDWYGWSWISYDPWGWAPYHYGRWFYNRPYGWCWWPGGIYARHYWRPALVAFFGWGGHHGFQFGVGVGFGFGSIGWVPLAPYEPYYPWYGHRYYRGYRNAGYIDRSVNIVNNVNITNIYRNSRIENAITAVNGADFGRGHVRNTYRRSDYDLRRTDLVRGQVPVVPGRESLRLANRDVRATSLPAGSPRNQFFSRRNVQAPDRIPFEEQRRGMERVARRAFEQTGNPRVAQSGGRSAERPAAGESPRATASQSSGWRRFGEPVRGTGSSRTGDVSGATSRSQSELRGRSAAADAGRWRRADEPLRSPSPRSGGSVNLEEGRSRAGTQPSSERPAATRSPRETGSRNSGWTRFGEPSGTATPAPTTRSSPGRQEGNTSGWQRFERGAAGRSRDSGSRFPERSIEDRSPRSSGRYESRSGVSPRAERPSSRESIRISPPIVRERSAPRYEPRSRSAPQSRGGSFEGFGGSRGSPRSPGAVNSGRSSGSPRSGGGSSTMGPRGGSGSSRGASSGRGGGRSGRSR